MLDKRFMCLIHESYRRKLVNRFFPYNVDSEEFGMAVFGDKGSPLLQLSVRLDDYGCSYPVYRLLYMENGTWFFSDYLRGREYMVDVDWAAPNYKARLCDDMRRKYQRVKDDGTMACFMREKDARTA